jgi:hypothetical protein
MLALVAEHVTGLEAYFSAGRLQQFQIVSHFPPPLHAQAFRGDLRSSLTVAGYRMM